MDNETESDDFSSNPNDEFHQLWDLHKTVPLFLIAILGPLACVRSPTFFTKFNSLGMASMSSLVKNWAISNKQRWFSLLMVWFTQELFLWSTSWCFAWLKELAMGSMYPSQMKRVRPISHCTSLLSQLWPECCHWPSSFTIASSRSWRTIDILKIMFVII